LSNPPDVPPAAPLRAGPADRRSETVVGCGYALAAFVWWGGIPLYFKAASYLPMTEVMAHRVFWSGAILAALIALRRRRHTLVELWGRPRTLLGLAISGLVLGGNWIVYIRAVATDQVLEASLGYYINPLILVVLGFVFLGERLSWIQTSSVMLASIGVGVLVWRQGELPWIAIALSVSFGVYGLIRKRVAADPQAGLLVETLVMSPFAGTGLLWLGSDNSFGIADLPSSLLLMAGGVVTIVPLAFFNEAARRLPLSLLGQFQYIGPSIAFLIAVFWFDEPFTAAHAVTFGCIWTALALFSWSSLRSASTIRRGAVATSARGD
jgi:chloramphenicol-sensitive protein RarD